MKVLFEKGDGLSIYYKRLEQGSFEYPNQEPDYRISTGNIAGNKIYANNKNRKYYTGHKIYTNLKS